MPWPIPLLGMRSSRPVSGTARSTRAEAILASHPDIAGNDIHVAAILGDDQGVRQLLALDACQRDGQEWAVGMGRADPLVLLEVPPPRQVAVRWFRAGGDGTARCRRQREHRLLRQGSPAGAGVGERAVRRRRRRAPRRADASAARAWRRSQRRRGAVPRAGNARQRRAEGAGRERSAHGRQPGDVVAAEGRLARLRRSRVPARARRRSQPHDAVAGHGPAPGRPPRQRLEEHRAVARPWRRPAAEGQRRRHVGRVDRGAARPRRRPASCSTGVVCRSSSQASSG